MIVEKECEICGILFEAHSKSQKYCPICKENPRTLKRQMKRALRDSYRRNEYSEIKLYDKICLQCGKTFKTSNPNKDCCNSACEVQFKTEHLTCLYCHSNLYAKGIIGNIHTKYNFCNDKCRTDYQYKQAKQKGNIHICKQCGKEFIRTDGKFCNNDCYKAYIATHKNQTHNNETKKIEVKPKPKIQYTCPVCKTVFESAYIPINNCCSKECNKIFRNKANKIDRQKRLKQYICENGMCGICTTSYVNCERMQSNFKIIPKGAKYINNKIQECPKFKTNFK